MKETVEEAAEKQYAEQSMAFENDTSSPIFDESRYLVAGFIDGAKWQSEQDNWISVEERLPETNEAFGESAFVLGIEEEFNEPVTVWYNSRHKIWRVAHYKADNDPINITHWQPLPHPPKA